MQGWEKIREKDGRKMREICEKDGRKVCLDEKIWETGAFLMRERMILFNVGERRTLIMIRVKNKKCSYFDLREKILFWFKRKNLILIQEEKSYFDTKKKSYFDGKENTPILMYREKKRVINQCLIEEKERAIFWKIFWKNF